MYFEVQVPSAQKDVGVRLQIEAANWRRALKTALHHSGITIDGMDGFYVELGDKAFQVTNPAQRHVYHVRVLDDKERSTSQVLKSLSGSHATVPAGQQRVDPSQSGQIKFKDRSTGKFRTIGAQDISLYRQEDPNESGGRILQESRMPTGNQSAVEEVYSPDSSGPHEPEDAFGGVSETALEDVFLEMPAIFEPGYATEDAIDFILDLAMKYIPCTHGGVLFAADTADSIYFASARGTGAEKCLEIDLPIDRGIAATALRNGFSLVVGDAPNDPRYDPTMANLTGIREQTVLAAPIQAGERAFGVVMLINRQQRDGFTQYDSNIVSYIASQMGTFIQTQLDSAPLE